MQNAINNEMKKQLKNNNRFFIMDEPAVEIKIYLSHIANWKYPLSSQTLLLNSVCTLMHAAQIHKIISAVLLNK